ncbi:bifunctional transaldolase/phosoglucose isomerase [Methylorubrum extorquens]|uniref:Transaldolase n=1 Tax=Methylorubrum extorquens (strain ATCC 14718 / DSM 1338 / JCM 2805 / NCIMB 9133 / AM1) TaxID=272630 RepID=C5B1R8_METEA|nr:bifunctional transaldolase/phosoglucose isomerase [Methylorubrum extorquens]ACS39702.1 putative Transaldolase Phosphoglucose isomerase [Methylorubrum extorquens AM1]MCP1542180.1 transaldolase/glucose-6-phosphate isomerase [Methylorubrum extorquens]MCP1590475.1 transaldolase/glucose-6-phosphate isomerase [Methylorubrum extorquens]
MNPLKALQDQGQAVWLDFVARGFMADGHLKKLVEEDGLRGVTSNPAIFEKAIAHSDEYDTSLRSAEAGADVPVIALFEQLAIEDIRNAADVLRPVYDATDGADGFVSLEVSPYLALETEDTIAEGRRLWREVGRENLMIKVPATQAGLPAIRHLIGEGINVNVTLLFAQDVYEAVANAYIEGLEALAAKGNVSRVASVASFFVSRIDSAIDQRLDQKIREANDPDEKAALERLKGKVAIANAKLAYQRYKRLFATSRWNGLAVRGARPQRLLWASTGAKNKAYRDVLYVEELIGPDAVNTMPPATLDAFRDHGRVRPSLEEGVGEAQRALVALARAGISLDEVTAGLVDDGVRLFVDAADKLLGAVASKRAAILGTRLNRQTLALGADLDREVGATIEQWRANAAARRLWRKDKSLWTGADEDRWLGWLDIIDRELGRVDAYRAFAEDVRREGFSDAVLLGMGGSSLGPEVLAETVGAAPGFPRLRILDSTDPAQVRAMEEAIDLHRTLFIVSSKSGSTLEPNIFKDYFFERVASVVGPERAGQRFVAVTDPGSSMEQAAQAARFWRIFHGDPGIGGRYSVLSAFGLVPAAAAGLDVGRFLESACLMARSCGPDVPPAENPGVRLGLAMGLAARQGRDKVTVVAAPSIAAFGAWAEQLIAESTGKDGKGLIPVAAEPLGPPEIYGQDRFFIHLRLEGKRDDSQEAALGALETAGHPVARIDLASPDGIVQEFFRWEFATAVAGAVIGINPFDQPDVEASKVRTRELTAAYEKSGELPLEMPLFSGEGVEVYADPRNADALRELVRDDHLEGWLRAHLRRLTPGDYFALLAYVARTQEHTAALQNVRLAVRDARRVATCLGFGPRFLHSTGQAYKGGPNSGVFLQVTADGAEDLAIPGHAFGFGTVKAAQARGDFEVLADRGRRALRVHLKGGDVAAGLGSLGAALRRALA